jgi:exonuclease VII large subunit
MNIGVFSSQLSDASKNVQLKIRALIAQSSGDLQFYSGILFERVDKILKLNNEALQRQVKKTQFDFNQYLVQSEVQLNDKLYHLKMNIGLNINNERSKLDTIKGLLFNNAENIVIDLEPAAIQKQYELVKLNILYLLSSSMEYLEFNIQKLGLVDPNQLFNKGYTISTVEGEDVNRRKKALKGKELITITNEYRIISKIKEINKRK